MILYGDTTLNELIDKYCRRVTLSIFILSFVKLLVFINPKKYEKNSLLDSIEDLAIFLGFLSMCSIVLACSWAGLKLISSSKIDPPENYAFESTESAKRHSDSGAKPEPENEQQQTDAKGKSEQRGQRQQDRQQESRHDQARNREKARAQGQNSRPKPPPRSKSWNEILGVPDDANFDAVRAAYRNLTKKYHPDVVATKSPSIRKRSEEKMKEINAAYQFYKMQRG